ncbi:MAG: hypothetical protein H7840_00755 [Alphaproteobacteria bacterium]
MRGMAGALAAVVMMVAVSLSAGSLSAGAGPIAEFEGRLREVYAQYRTALLAAEAGDRQAATAAVGGFIEGWAAVVKAYSGAPPPHYSEDPEWTGTLDAVRDMAEDARSSLGRGDIEEARHSLEEIRDVMADLRRRNGIIGFGDRLVAFHEQMEGVIDSDFARIDGRQRGVLREQTAVLLYLVGAMRRDAPTHLAIDDEFKSLVDALDTVIEALHDSLSGSDRAAMLRAAKAIRPAYARLFRKYG